MWNIRRLAQLVAVLTAMVLVWSGPAAAVLAQDDATSPGDRPLEIVVDGERFVFDRIVPIDLGALEEGADEEGNPVFTKADDPVGAVYIAGDDETTAARYLPESLDAPDTSCLNEGVPAGNITAGDDVYIPAGPEPDLGTDALTEVGSTDDGRAIYAASEEQPFTELFADSDDGLIRYLLLGDDGAPATFPGTISFAGQEFEVAADAEVPGTDGLTQVGCLGPFPALAEGGAEAPFATVYLSLNDQVITYQALDAPAETEEAAEEPATPPEADETPEATPAETEEATLPPPTEVPTDVPTEVPATPEPTDVPTELPTEVPTEVPTEEPDPTAVPTDVPAPTDVPPTEAPDPTDVPPTEEPEATEAPAPTDVPPTEEPEATEAPAPTDVPAAPAPTEAPAPAPPEAPAPAVPAAPAPGAPAATQAPADPAAPTSPPADPAAPPTPRPTPTPRVYQPQAVVPTPAPDAPPAAVATAPATRCSGVTGELDANGVPARLANSYQYGGTGYQFESVVPMADAGNLTLVGCIGPFEAYRGDAQDATTVLFLALPNGGGSTLFRYDASSSFNVTFEVSDNPQSLTLQAAGDQPETRYTASEPWVRSVYSSVTLILYVADPNNAQPEVIYGRAVDSDVIAEYVPEGTIEAPAGDVATLAEQTGLQPDLTLGAGGPRYVLAAVWQPFGTTTNGWLTLYGPSGEAVPARLCGVDPRRLDLLIFEQAP